MATDGQPRRRRPLAVVFFTVLLDLLGFGMVLPLLPFYGQELGAGPLGVTLLFASFSLAQFVAAPLWGRLSDRLGRRPVLLVSLVGAVAAYGLFTAASSFLTLLLARTASGAAAANYAIAQAYVADVTPPGERTRGMGFLGAAFGLGFVLGPVMGGLVGHLGFRAVPAAALVLSVLDLVLVWFFLPESLPPERRAARSRGAEGGGWLSRAAVRRAIGDRRSAALLGLYFVVILAFANMEATLALYCELRFGFGFFETAWLFTFVGVVMAVVQGGLIGRLAARFGERRLIVAGIALMTAGLALLPTPELVPGLAAGAPMLALLGGTMVLLAVGMGVNNPATLGLLSRRTAEERQGGTLGVARSAGALARGVGPIWGGWAFARLGPGWPFWSAAALMAGALALAVVTVPAAAPARKAAPSD